MTKRRTRGIQRRSRASQEALERRLEAPGGRVPWMLVALIGGLVLAVAVAVVALLAGSGPNPAAGEQQPDAGAGHVPDGGAGGPFASVPATSGAHWDTPGNWGVYTTPQPEAQLVHNLEHGGIVIWYQPDSLSADEVAELSEYVSTQVRSTRFKMILSPWGGEDFGHPVAVTAWRWLLYQDEVDIGAIRGFVDAHYGDAPEPNGGPGPPGG